MKTLFVIIALGIVSMGMVGCTNAIASSSRENKIEASKNYVTKQISVSDFNKIRSSGCADIIFTQQEGAPQVEIYGSDNIVELLDIYVKDGTLVVKMKKNVNITNNKKLEVRICAETLNEVKISGAGDVKFTNRLSTDVLAVSISGAGDFEGMDIVCQSFFSTVSGAGDVKIAGTAEKAEFVVSGAGDVDASRFKAKDVKVSVSGAGDVVCNAENLSSHVSGSGEVKNVAKK